MLEDVGEGDAVDDSDGDLADYAGTDYFGGDVGGDGEEGEEGDYG